MIKKVLAIAATAAVLVFNAGPALADQGGCPNEASANGAVHANNANNNSAHGSEKQQARECVVVPPTE